MNGSGKKRTEEKIVYGINPIVEAISNDRVDIEKIFITKSGVKGRVGALLRIARERGIPVSNVPRSVLRRISGTDKNQGIAASLSAARYCTKDEILNAIDERSILLVLDGVEDPGNFGAIVRTAVATGVTGIFIPVKGAVGMTDAAAKRSAGAVFHARVARERSLIALADDLKKRGLFMVAFDVEGAKSIFDLQIRFPIAVVLGSEEKGIRRELLDRMDETAGIPMNEKVESLNVSVSAGIILYELLRKRRFGSSVPMNR